MGSTASRLQSHYEETVYFFLLSSQDLLVLPMSFVYISKHCSISVIHRATDASSAQSIFHSPRYTNLHSSFQTIKQNKSLLLANNNGSLILLAQKKSSQVVWFHSTSIFQHLLFYYLLESVAIYFQCYAFHGASIYDTFHETSNRDDYRTVEFLGTQFSVCFRKK